MGRKKEWEVTEIVPSFVSLTSSFCSALSLSIEHRPCEVKHSIRTYLITERFPPKNEPKNVKCTRKFQRKRPEKWAKSRAPPERIVPGGRRLGGITLGAGHGDEPGAEPRDAVNTQAIYAQQSGWDGSDWARGVRLRLAHQSRW